MAITAKVRECDVLELDSRVAFDQSYMQNYPNEERCIFSLRYDESEHRVKVTHENGTGFGEREEDFESVIYPDMTTDQLVALYEECCRSLPAPEPYGDATIGGTL